MIATPTYSADDSVPSEDYSAWRLERRPDGAVVVRVPSQQSGSNRLPDAVFAFRVGDPQFGFWEQMLRNRQG